MKRRPSWAPPGCRCSQLVRSLQQFRDSDNNLSGDFFGPITSPLRNPYLSSAAGRVNHQRSRMTPGVHLPGRGGLSAPSDSRPRRV